MLKKKLLAWILTFGLGLSMVAAPATADSRLGISASSSMVVHGTTATLSPSLNSVGENSSYDWSLLKWEVSRAVGQSLSGNLAVWQLNSGQCQGTTSGPSGSYRTCNTPLGGNRIVVSAATSYANGSSATAKITATDGEATLRIRLWLDRNNNNQIDPYEPAAKALALQVLNPNKIQPFVNFNMDPPVIGENVLRASVSAGSVVGASNGLYGLIDPTKLSIRITQCRLNTCTQILGAAQWVTHPQRVEYEFVSDLTFAPDSGFGAELLYTESPSEVFVLAARSFDYRHAEPLSLETSLTAPNGLFAASSSALPHLTPRQTTVLAADALNSFVYTAQISGADGKPAVNREAYVMFDLKDFSDSTTILVNGKQLTKETTDRVVIKRRSDSNGDVKLNITAPSHNWMDRIGIDVLVNGYRSWEIPGNGAEQVIAWDADGIRQVELSFSKSSSSGSSDKYITLKARVSDGSGRLISGEKILFGGEDPVTVENPVQTVSGGYAQADVRLRDFIDLTGETKIRVLVISANGSYEVEQTLRWENYGEKISGGSDFSPLQASHLPDLGAKIWQPSSKTVTMSVPGTNQVQGIQFLVNGRTIRPQAKEAGLTASAALSKGKNSLQILINGRIAAERVIVRK